MSKKISIAPRPSARQADEWVSTPVKGKPEKAHADGEDMKRLTIDIPAALHRRVKSECAAQGEKMADVVRDLLIQKYGKA